MVITSSRLTHFNNPNKVLRIFDGIMTFSNASDLDQYEFTKQLSIPSL